MAEGFDFDLLHKELEETEHYLRKSTTSLRGSGDFVRSSLGALRTSIDQLGSDDPSSGPGKNPAPENQTAIEKLGDAATFSPSTTPEQRAADSKNREQLIQRLLADYNQRKSKTPKSYLDLPDEPGRPATDGADVDEWRETPLEFGSPDFQRSPPYDDTTPDNLRSESHGGSPSPYGMQDTIFFASDAPDMDAPARSSLDLAATVPFTAGIAPWNRLLDGGGFTDDVGLETVPIVSGVEDDDLELDSVSPAEPLPRPPPPRAPRSRPVSVPRSADSSRSSQSSQPPRSSHPSRPSRPSVVHPPKGGMPSTIVRPTTPQFAKPFTSAEARDPSPTPRPHPTSLRPTTPDPTDRYMSLVQDLERRKARSRSRLEKEADERFHAAHTFRPALATAVPATRSSRSPSRDRAPAPTSSASGRDRVEELHRDHAQRMRKRQAMRQELEEVERLQCPFQPQIAAASTRLAQTKDLRARYLQDDDAGGGGAVGVGERLHTQAAAKMQRQHERSKYLQEQSLADYTFQPELLSSSKGKVAQSPRAPIHERVVDLQKDKQRRLAELREAWEQEQQRRMPFKPAIDDHSRVLAKGSSHHRRSMSPSGTRAGYEVVSDDDGFAQAMHILSQGEDIGTRLMREGQRMARRKQELLWAREREMSEIMEAPLVSVGSSRWVKKSAFVAADFTSRQHAYEQRRTQHQEQVERDVADQQQQWFQPAHLPSNAKTETILVQQRPHVLEESVQKRVDRLSRLDAKDKADHRKALEDEIYQSLRFEPSLDPKSLARGRKSSVQMLHDDAKAKHARQLVKDRLEAEEATKCTFQPQISDKSRRIASQSDSYDVLFQQYYQQRGYQEPSMPLSPTATGAPNSLRINIREPEKMASDIRMHMLKKEERRREELILKEIHDLQDCTFRPESHTRDYDKYRVQFEAPVVIPGLARHLELQELTRKQREEEMERERQVFSVPQVDKFRRPEDGSTIVEEFQFRLPARYSREELRAV